METIWTLFENWLKENWIEGLNELNPPATEQEIIELQESLGVQLPNEFVISLRIHNGQRDDSPVSLFEDGELLSTREILVQWQCWKKLVDCGQLDDCWSAPDDGVKNDWFNLKWVPFTHNGGGDHLCIDLDPTSAGQHGQVITMWHDDPRRKVTFASFRCWFEHYVGAVLRGQYVYSEQFGGLVDLDSF